MFTNVLTGFAINKSWYTIKPNQVTTINKKGDFCGWRKTASGNEAPVLEILG